MKTIFSTSFDTFEIRPSRKATGKPLIGNGITVADGAEWHAARALLRPSFSKNQINDLKMLEHQFETFLQIYQQMGIQWIFKSSSKA